MGNTNSTTNSNSINEKKILGHGIPISLNQNNINYFCCKGPLNSSNFNMNNVPNRMEMNKGCNLFSNDKQLLNANFQDLVTYLNNISKTNPSLKLIKTSNFFDDMLLNTNMFDKRGNKGPNNYTVQGLRGGKIYEGPIGWIGYGLSVNKYGN
jgi:hypothetical protein